jgi:hypothetical protein
MTTQLRLSGRGERHQHELITRPSASRHSLGATRLGVLRDDIRVHDGAQMVG